MSVAQLVSDSSYGNIKFSSATSQLVVVDMDGMRPPQFSLSEMSCTSMTAGQVDAAKQKLTDADANWRDGFDHFEYILPPETNCDGGVGVVCGFAHTPGDTTWIFDQRENVCENIFTHAHEFG